MDRAPTIEQAADEFIDEYGEVVVEVLQGRAKAAAGLGDAIAAETWSKTADVTARKLQQQSKP